MTTAGYDIELAYTRQLMGGTITGSLNANYVEKLRQFAFADYPEQVDREEGEVGDPRWSFTSSLTYAKGPWTLTWESQFTDRVRFNKDLPLERYDRPYVEAVWYHDLIGRYRLDCGGEPKSTLE